jgi:plasmid stabilization system protein ParE
MRVDFHPEAETEFTEHAFYYEYEVTGLGYRFIDEIERAITILIDQPQIGQAINEQLRSFVLAEFPFSLIYSLNQEMIWIVEVAHQKRLPDYWRERINAE